MSMSKEEIDAIDAMLVKDREQYMEIDEKLEFGEKETDIIQSIRCSKGEKVPNKFKEKLLDKIDDYKIRAKNIFDFKYKKERKNKKLEEGVMDRVPVKNATIKDIENLSRQSNTGQTMNCVKLKSGVTVVVPGSARSIRKEFKDATIVESLIKE